MHRLKYIYIFIAALFITLASTGPVSAQNLEEDPQAVTHKDVTIVKDGTTTFIFEEERMARVRHILGYLLQNARDHAMNGETALAAQEIDMAAAFMYMDVQSSPADLRTKVEQVAENLETIAAAADSSKTPVAVFDNAIYSAHHALARYYQQRAETYAASDFSRNAGFSLEAALTHYKNAALSWARVNDMPMNEVIDQELLAGLEEFAAAMKSGHAYSEADASGLIDRLDIAISELTSQS